MQITYGTREHNIDVTEIVFQRCVINNVAHIPRGDGNRAYFFTDPLPNILKSIFIDSGDGIFVEHEHSKNVFIDISTNAVTNSSKLDVIHSKLKIDFGNFSEEYPEQMLTSSFLTGNEKVLELGGNIGRNSLVIGSIVENKNFVSMECDKNIAKQLIHNRDINNLSFHVEPSALSKRRLIQKGWETVVSDYDQDGYTEVSTITLHELRNKYAIDFDTLILDCEGAFYYILQDMPEILNGVNLIIMENDYFNLEHKLYVDEVLRKNNFCTELRQSGGWGPCSSCFYEVWKRKSD
jgi:FkbM family methyltransferase